MQKNPEEYGRGLTTLCSVIISHSKNIFCEQLIQLFKAPGGIFIFGKTGIAVRNASIDGPTKILCRLLEEHSCSC